MVNAHLQTFQGGLTRLPLDPPLLAQRWVQNFPRWDRDGNGQVEPIELFEAISATQPTVEDAAALATLYREVLHESHQLNALPAVDKSRLKAYLLNLETRRLDLAFLSYQAKIAGQGEPLCQGQAPSCLLVSTAYALQQRDPEAIAKMVTSTPEGLTVKFPGLEQPVKISPLTDTEKALHTTGLEAVEKAWGTLEGGGPPGAIANARGHGAEKVISAFTGNPAKTALLPNTSMYRYLNAAIQKKKPGSPELKPEPLEPILTRISAALKAKAVVLSGTWREVTRPDLQIDHAYTVTACDTQTITLRNPYGSDITLPMADYLANFNSVTCEERTN